MKLLRKLSERITKREYWNQYYRAYYEDILIEALTSKYKTKVVIVKDIKFLNKQRTFKMPLFFFTDSVNFGKSTITLDNLTVWGQSKKARVVVTAEGRSSTKAKS